MTTCCLGSLLLELGLSSVTGEKMSGEEETRTILELQTKVCEDFTIIVEGAFSVIVKSSRTFV